MLPAILTTLIIVAALIYSAQSGRRSGLIVHRPYNNPHNDASGARDDHLG